MVMTMTSLFVLLILPLLLPRRINNKSRLSPWKYNLFHKHNVFCRRRKLGQYGLVSRLHFQRVNNEKIFVLGLL